MRSTYGGPDAHYTSARVWRMASEGSESEEILLYVEDVPDEIALPDNLTITPAKNSSHWRKPVREHDNPNANSANGMI